MGIKQHGTGETFNATPRRVSMLAKHLKGRIQGAAAAQCVHLNITEWQVEHWLNDFIDQRKLGGK